EGTPRQSCVRTEVDTRAYVGSFNTRPDHKAASTISICSTTIAAMPKTPEQWLEEADPAKKGGVFKLFLGYAPGVGKTFSMLSEAIRRHSRGEDVVIGVIESHGRKATAELAAQLDGIPRK